MQALFFFLRWLVLKKIPFVLGWTSKFICSSVLYMKPVVKIAFAGVLWRQINVYQVLGRAHQEIIEPSKACAINKSWPVSSMRRKLFWRDAHLLSIEHPLCSESRGSLGTNSTCSDTNNWAQRSYIKLMYVTHVLEPSLTWVLLQSVHFKRIWAWPKLLDSEWTEIMTKYKSTFGWSFRYAFP